MPYYLDDYHNQCASTSRLHIWCFLDPELQLSQSWSNFSSSPARHELLLFSSVTHWQLSRDSSHHKEQHLGKIKERDAKFFKFWGVHVSVCMWRPEVNTRCLPHSLFTIFFFETGSLTEPQLKDFPRQADQQALRSFCLSLFSSRITGVHCCLFLAFMGMMGMKLKLLRQVESIWLLTHVTSSLST